MASISEVGSGPLDAETVAPSTDAFTTRVPAVEETHISVLVLVGNRVYKLKKPIELPFLDWRDREERHRACWREVELNRRLAPDVYLDVVDVVDSKGRACDHLVVMQRMPEERRLSRVVREQPATALHAPLDDLARLLATFHSGAQRSEQTIAAASRDSVRANWEDNLVVMRVAGATVLDQTIVDRIDELAHRYLDGRASLFDERGRSGLAIDGHGDLLADDIYLLDDGPRVLDCIEFSDRLRAVDVLDDIAFLAMDLEHLGVPDLASYLLDAYDRHSGERHPDSLAHHYIAYRAGVRCKVACVRASQHGGGAESLARAFADLALAHLEAARVRVVLVGGLPGTGKSTLATSLGHRTGWVVLRSDAIRKEILGIPADQSMHAAYQEGIYEPARTSGTYATMLERARELVERGRSVILDASWTDHGQREHAADVAARSSSDLVELRCEAPIDVARQRLIDRDRRDPSDATPEVLRRLSIDRAEDLAGWDRATVIDTTKSIDESTAGALEAALRVRG